MLSQFICYYFLLPGVAEALGYKVVLFPIACRLGVFLFVSCCFPQNIHWTMPSAFSVSRSLFCLLGSFSLSQCARSALVAVTVLSLSLDSLSAFAIWRHFMRVRSVSLNKLSCKLESCASQTILSLIREFLMWMPEFSAACNYLFPLLLLS